MAPLSSRTGLLLLLSQTLIAIAIIGATLNLFTDQDHIILYRNRTQLAFQPLPYRTAQMPNVTGSSKPIEWQPYSGLSENINETTADEIRKRVKLAYEPFRYHTPQMPNVSKSSNSSSWQACSCLHGNINETATVDNSTSQIPNVSESSNSSRWRPHNGLQKNMNETAVDEIRKHINANLSRCQVMQIVRPGIPEQEIVTHFVNESEPSERTLARIADRNQSDCVPLHENCAIVGNSGILQGSQCGDVIDSAQYVIRFNLALLGERFEKDVGARTDVMTMNYDQMVVLTSCMLPKKKGRRAVSRTRCNDLMTRMNIFKEENRVLWFFKDCTFWNSVNEALGLMRKKNGLDFRLAYSPGSPMSAATRLLKVRIPSSGFAAYVAATQFCRNISLFGFYPFNNTTKGAILNHYYDKKPLPSRRTSKYAKKQIQTVHNMPMEYEFLTDLARKGAIRIINDCNRNNTAPDNTH